MKRFCYVILAGLAFGLGLGCGGSEVSSKGTKTFSAPTEKGEGMSMDPNKREK